MDIRERYKIGDIIRLVVPFNPKQIERRNQDKYIVIDGVHYYKDKKAIIIGYNHDCKFTINSRFEGAIAIGINGDILYIHNDSSWRTISHCDFNKNILKILSKTE